MSRRRHCNYIIICIILFTVFNKADYVYEEIICSDDQSCANKIINCLSEEDCLISCDGTSSCKGSTIKCPHNADCNIRCKGKESCYDTTIDAEFSNGSLNILCHTKDDKLYDDNCRNMIIIGSTLETNTADLNIECNADQRTCYRSTINCPKYGDCDISCNGGYSCSYSQIIGPIDGELNVNCNGNNSCSDIIIDARYSSKLNITGCQSYASCIDITLYCPSNTNDEINCFLEGNQNLGKRNAVGTTIYAINGWDDITIDYSGTYKQHGGTIYCTEYYNQSCTIADDRWSCRNTLDPCNNPPILRSVTSTITSTTTATSATTDTQHDTTLIALKEQLEDKSIETITTTTTDIDGINNSHNTTFTVNFTFVLDVWLIILGIVLIGLVCCWYAHKGRKRKQSNTDGIKTNHQLKICRISDTLSTISRRIPDTKSIANAVNYETGHIDGHELDNNEHEFETQPETVQIENDTRHHDNDGDVNVMKKSDTFETNQSNYTVETVDTNPTRTYTSPKYTVAIPVDVEDDDEYKSAELYNKYSYVYHVPQMKTSERERYDIPIYDVIPQDDDDDVDDILNNDDFHIDGHVHVRTEGGRFHFPLNVNTVLQSNIDSNHGQMMMNNHQQSVQPALTLRRSNLENDDSDF